MRFEALDGLDAMRAEGRWLGVVLEKWLPAPIFPPIRLQQLDVDQRQGTEQHAFLLAAA